MSPQSLVSICKTYHPKQLKRRNYQDGPAWTRRGCQLKELEPVNFVSANELVDASPGPLSAEEFFFRTAADRTS